jgi:hypothetical protein
MPAEDLNKEHHSCPVFWSLLSGPFLTKIKSILFFGFILWFWGLIVQSHQ